MNNERKIFSEWIKEIEIKIYSSGWRKLEENDTHTKKITAQEFIRLLSTIDFTFDNRNIFNKKLLSFADKHSISENFIAKMLELKRDDYVKFKLNNKIQIGRYQSEVNNGKDVLEIEVNENDALNFYYVEKNKILFPTKKEISRVAKKEIEARTKRERASLPENIFNYRYNRSFYDYP
ncbi:MAG TPA: hypothetical protein VLN45_05330 [Ignavibacteriaceae bacterium]|nr:hypothetical protein [Ignavibacteriaceae bacterium]